jgi:hypothetical protein
VSSQPHPTVTRADVERIVRREFSPDRELEILAMLSEYGTEEWHGEPDRVHLAILKLSGGDLERLRMQVETAKSDYRDVLGPAEYPGYTKHMFRIDRLSADEQQKIIDADWKQYQDWFSKR